MANATGMALRQVRKSFGGHEVIHGIDLDIEAGEFVVFVGPSGCGKSTLLRMIAGLEEVTDGEIEIGGRDVTNLDPSVRGIAMVFQSYALYPHMSVRDNLGFGLKMAHSSKGDIERQVEAAARILKIEALLDRRARPALGGQRQRVAIGRAIVRKPEVFLFDEPLSNLDAELRVSMRIEIARLHRELGNTMVYVTHDQTEAMTLADKIVVLRDGRIEQVGSPREVYEDPANAFVAGFIGSPKMNFLNAVAMPDSTVTVAGARLAPATRARAVGPVTLGLRPEHLVLGPSGDDDLPASAEFTEYLGGTRFLYARLADGQSIVAEHRDGPDVVPGQMVHLRCPKERMRLFAGTGERLR
ncbi:putative sugar uptake ABC transporter ATP-binding protein [Rubellimicrobium mesophilum DSM 19309]|uniref:Putative sugar uptake ABC transporter ATP-binding protein n=1 Tax=Rubellimicrobium mesophilum DSM 19309 TaxID=442562 RepID=A0A017HUW4_9RHOB|nr:sn-glycerol-3-phosphate ABC transporter ATP-binding protein UgpC [Rubellimicrobium mesophilum]EYD78176.1 putative sugar uptake ABC transporter ATP-binding protein [Rubellimicrobium mesophilum DSM 19309]